MICWVHFGWGLIFKITTYRILALKHMPASLHCRAVAQLQVPGDWDYCGWCAKLIKHTAESQTPEKLLIHAYSTGPCRSANTCSFCYVATFNSYQCISMPCSHRCLRQRIQTTAAHANLVEQWKDVETVSYAAALVPPWFQFLQLGARPEEHPPLLGSAAQPEARNSDLKSCISAYDQHNKTTAQAACLHMDHRNMGEDSWLLLFQS